MAHSFSHLSKPSDLFARGNETGDWRGVWDEFRNWLTAGAGAESDFTVATPSSIGR
jgi:hypothetical protein